MLSFPNVSPAAFALVLDQLRKEGSSVIHAFTNDNTSHYSITGHHWPLGDINAHVAFDGATVTVDVVQPKSWESAIGERIGKSIEAAQRTVAGESA